MATPEWMPRCTGCERPNVLNQGDKCERCAYRELLEAAETALNEVHQSFESDGYFSGRAMCGECEASWHGTGTSHETNCRGGRFNTVAAALRAALASVKGEAS